MFERGDGVKFGFLAILVMFLNVVAWLAVIGGTVLILKAAGVF